ncbi:hypothetical protein BX616_010098 [Lobosporangium transversale]|uniref:RNA polymerase III RPC4-domain-containing protein n=1 Tax=Lobosporangium transversale TaxID=64571 RepID=A0A1Y2GNN7_9FUNG|nr:RNA polymerase III RPC4-domain-containing protein [Lobosporangium transversale]KAF9918144.1 hypothetical protein BX616_010098 [Lobosporangium transversale]ORZ16793.1 RNA polymerase III RPC4-domain-containing protein [Lobosporangium transversale]|eukprot:XP_021881728.1 RNA polymerase III RPC4-domain-containing protein [Lobosporangium transversale]
MSEDTGSSSTNNPRPGTPVGRGAGASGTTSALGSIGSIHTPTATPAGRLSSLRGGRGGAIGSSASTRGGTMKMKFAPTIPTKRNKKDVAPSLLEEARAGSEAGGSSRGRGERGERGSGRGRGRGRGRFEDVAATASGPFSLGPAAFARSRVVASGGGTSGAHSSYTGVQAVKVEQGEGLSGEDREYYGAAAVDMKFGSTATDASAPTGLESPKDETKSGVTTGTKEDKMKEQELEQKTKTELGHTKTFEGNNQGVYDGDDEDIKPKIEGPARDLLPSFETDRLFFFQFPSVMPAFKPRVVTDIPMSSVISSSVSSPERSSYSTPDNVEKTEDSEDGLLAVKAEPMDVDRSTLIADNTDLSQIKTEQSESKIGIPIPGGALMSSSSSSAPVGQRAKPKVSTTTGGGNTLNGSNPVEKEEVTESHLQQEGKIGRLLIYKSGKVKMQIGDIVMDVSSGADCSFLQDVVVVDSANKQAFVMGTVDKRLICVPNLTHLLSGLEASDV